jgi:predicted Fe-Mo cluster-binding NifX family protein
MLTMLRIPNIVVILLLYTACSALAAGEPVIAVAAEGETAEASVSSQSARSPYFLLFDDRGVLVEAVANPFREVQRGAGPQVADFLAAKGLRIIIAGEFGPRMINALQGRQMEFRTAAGSAADAAAAAAEQ